MKILHKKILELLREIDAICRKYDITYYAAGGTTIGAIRHKGFIPWDDDADIYMTRENFEKFRVAFNKEGMKGRELGCIENDPIYNATIPRYIDTSTTCITRYNVGRYSTSGILIDIFILDPVSADELDQARHINLLSVYSDLVMPFYSYSFRNDDAYIDAYDEYKKMADEIGKEATLSALEKEIFSYPENDAEYYILRWGSGPHIFPKNMFKEPVYFDFHDFSMPVPTLWFEYLVQLYGLNWTHFPKFIQDEGHISVVDEKIPYINYVRDYEPYLDIDKVEKDCYDRKDYLLKRAVLRRPFEQKLLDSLEKYVHISIGDKVKNAGCELETLFNNRKYDQILGILEMYTKYQFSTPFIGNIFHSNLYRYRNPRLIRLSDREYFILICAYINTNRFKEAKKLLELLRRKDRLDSSEQLIKLNTYFDMLIDAMGAYYYEKYDKALKLIEEVYSFGYFHVSLMDQIKFNTLLKLGTDPADVLNQVEASLDLFKDDIDILKIKGDCFYALGRELEAREIYNIVVKTSNNGIALNDIELKTNIVPEIITEEKGHNKPNSMEGETHLKLLTEIHDLCCDNDIQYSLSRDTALYAYQFGCFRSEFNRPTIFMTAENAKKFIEVFDNSDIGNRKLRFRAYGKNNIGANFEYCDTNTSRISFSTREWGNASVYIEIPEKHAVGVSSKWIALKKLVALAEYRANNNNKAKHRVMKIASSAAKQILGSKSFDRRLCMECIDNTIKNKLEETSGYYSIFHGRHFEETYLPDEWFEEYSTVELYGQQFNVIKDIEDYVEDMYGMYVYDDLKVRPVKTNAYKLLDLTLPIERLVKTVIDPVYEGDAWDGYLDSKKYTKLSKNSYKAFIDNWNTILRTESRFMLAKKYSGSKAKVIEAYEAKDFDQLGSLLEDYDKEAVWFEKRGLGLCFDPEIFEIYCEWLINNGRSDFAGSLKSLIPIENYTGPDLGVSC